MGETYPSKKRNKCQLFIIKQIGRAMFWNCSTEHGCGWHSGYPKQAWSKSELTAEIGKMIERDYFQNCEIVELEFTSA